MAGKGLAVHAPAGLQRPSCSGTLSACLNRTRKIVAPGHRNAACGLARHRRTADGAGPRVRAIPDRRARRSRGAILDRGRDGKTVQVGGRPRRRGETARRASSVGTEPTGAGRRTEIVPGTEIARDRPTPRAPAGQRAPRAGPRRVAARRRPGGKATSRPVVTEPSRARATGPSRPAATGTATPSRAGALGPSRPVAIGMRGRAGAIGPSRPASTGTATPSRAGPKSGAIRVSADRASRGGQTATSRLATTGANPRTGANPPTAAATRAPNARVFGRAATGASRAGARRVQASGVRPPVGDRWPEKAHA